MACSKEYYQPGDLVYQGKPFAKVLGKNVWGAVCAACLSRKIQLLSCRGCDIMKYCNRKCQKRGWTDHKYECPFLKNLPDHEPQLLVQILGNVIMQLKGKDWKSVTEKVLDNEVSFDDLPVPSDGKRFCPEENLDLLFKSIKVSLRIYIGENNMPNDDELYKLFLKVINNSVVQLDFAVLFLGLTKFTVSCVRNCSSLHTYDGFTIRATKRIRKGSEKLSISLNPLLLINHRGLSSSRLQDCSKRPEDCSDCSQPFGESPFTKVLNVCKSLDIISETECILRFASCLIKLKGPYTLINRPNLKLLLERQKGVLGDTNLLRIRTLALKCLFVRGPLQEVRDELKQLITWIEAACGKNSVELILVYQELMCVSLQLLDFRTAENGKKEIERLIKICYGDAPFRPDTVVGNQSFDDVMREAFEDNLHSFFRFLSMSQ